MTLARRTRFVALLTVALLGLSACGSGPPPRLYLLDAPVGEALEGNSDTSAISALGISLVEVPGYASDARIASRKRDGYIVQLDTRRWAEEPEDAITRLLAVRLRAHATATVLVEPWPRDYNPQARVEVVFGRLLSEPDGGAHLTGHIHLLSGDGRKLLRSVPFDFRESGLSTEMSEFFRVVALSIDHIARTAVEALLAMKLKS